MDVEQALNQRGYALVPGAARDMLPTLRTIAASAPGGARRFTSSARDAERSERRRIDDEVREALQPVVDVLLGPTRILIGGIVTKGSGAPALGLHQDLTYTDERRHRGLTVWVPTVDVTSENGALIVVPGSHRWGSGIRPAGPGADRLTPSEQRRLAQRARRLLLDAGSVVVWDNALLHGSLPNIGPEPRPAVAATSIPAGADAYTFYCDQDGLLEGFAFGDRYLEMDDVFMRRPVGCIQVTPWGQRASRPLPPLQDSA